MISHQTRRRQNSSYNNNIKDYTANTTMMTNNNKTSPSLSEQQQMKSILEKLQLLKTDPPLFFVHCNDVNFVNNLVSAITTILTLTPRALKSSAPVDNPSHVILALSNASSLLSSSIDTLISIHNNGGGKRKNIKRPTMETMTLMSKNKSSNSNSNVLSRTVGRSTNKSKNRKHQQKVSATMTTAALSECSNKFTDAIQREANAILSHVYHAKDIIEVSSNVLYNKIVAAGCFEEKYECTSPQSVHLALIAHTHRFVDALLAFNGSTTEGEWIARSTKHNGDASHRQHQVVNGQLGTGAISNSTYRRSADLPKSNKQQQQQKHSDNNRTLKRKSAETAGSRFMRSLSSSFRNSTSSSTKSSSTFDHETSPRSSKSSTISFSGSSFINEENDSSPSWSTIKIKPEENVSSISAQSSSHRSSTSTSTSNTSSSNSKSAIRTFFGSATTIVRHGRDHQISPTSKKSSIIPIVTKQLNHHNLSSPQSSTATWRHLFTSSAKNNNNDNRASKYETNNDSTLMIDEDDTTSSNLNNHRLSFTTDHITEIMKSYPREQHRWSCGDDMKYSAAEISRYNSNYSFYGTNSRRLSSEQRKRERYAATLRLKEKLGNNNDDRQQTYPKISTVFRQDTSNNNDIDSTLLSSVKIELDPDSGLVNKEKHSNNGLDQHLRVQDYYHQTVYRRSLSDDDDELEMLTMGTYGPLTPISVADLPTLPSCDRNSSPITFEEPKRSFNEEMFNENREEEDNITMITLNTSQRGEEANLDRISTCSSSYFSAQSFSSYSSLHSSRSHSQSKILDLEVVKYHANNASEEEDMRRLSIESASAPTYEVNQQGKDNNNFISTNDAAKLSSKTIVEPSSSAELPMGIVPDNVEMKSSKYATISSTTSTMYSKEQQQRSSSTLLSKAMVVTEGRSSPLEELPPSQQSQHQQPTTSHRSVATIGISNISSVFSRHHWSPHKKAVSSQGNKKPQAKTIIHQRRHQRRNPIPFSISNNDMNNNENISPTESSLSVNTFRDISSRSLETETRANDELNHFCENGEVTLVTQPIIRDKQKVIAGTGAQLFKKLVESATHDLDYVDTYLLSHQAFISSASLFDKLKEIFQHNVCHEYGVASQRSIQLRVINVMSRWIKLQYEDFKADNDLLNRLYRFLNNNMHVAHLAKDLATIKEQLEVQNKQQEQRFSSSSTGASLPRTKSTGSLDPEGINSHSGRPHAPQELYTSGAGTLSSSHGPSPSTFKKGGAKSLALSSTSSALASLDAKDVAQYLTLADFNVLKNITPYEYLKGTWRSNTANNSNNSRLLNDSKKDGYTKILTRRANMLSHWVLHEVCSPENPKQRRIIIRKFIHIAKLCIEWNNFHTGMIIVMGLQCPVIQRMENTWHALPSRDISAFNALQKYLDVTNNMGFYRQSLASAKAPVVPFFPLILKDLTFFMDGNPTLSTPPPFTSQQQRLESLSRTQPSYPKLINFDKFRVLTQFVNTLMNYTTVNYWFASDLEHCPFLPHISVTGPIPSLSSLSSSSSSQFLTTDIPILDRVAELVEIKIRSVESCYEDSKCGNQWISSMNIRKMGK